MRTLLLLHALQFLQQLFRRLRLVILSRRLSVRSNLSRLCRLRWWGYFFRLRRRLRLRYLVIYSIVAIRIAGRLTSIPRRRYRLIAAIPSSAG